MAGFISFMAAAVDSMMGSNSSPVRLHLLLILQFIYIQVLSLHLLP